MTLQRKEITTAPSWYQPSIPLVDPASGEKIKLSLRHMEFGRELRELPGADLKALHHLLLSYRTTRHEGIYMSVLVWSKLRAYEKYWEVFRFNSEDEYLVYYDLPDGATLAGWTVMVALFDKTTFMLLGDEVLSFMMRAVGEYMGVGEERKKAYQAIFDRYCGAHDAFDKASFYDCIRRYVVEMYEKPLAKEDGISHEDWLKKKWQLSAGNRKRRRVVIIPGRRNSGKVEKDFEWKPEPCPHCAAKDQILVAYREYVASLEEVIREKLGEQFLPARSPVLRTVVKALS